SRRGDGAGQSRQPRGDVDPRTGDQGNRADGLTLATAEQAPAGRRSPAALPRYFAGQEAARLGAEGAAGPGTDEMHRLFRRSPAQRATRARNNPERSP